jgi:hypothetical protein
VACEGDSPAGNTFALYRPGAARLFELPYPSDLRVKGDGTIDLAHLSHGQLELVQRYVDFVKTNPTGGFALSGGAFFRFSGPIDPLTLPATPEASRSRESSVQWIDLTTGQRLPAVARFNERGGRVIGDHNLSVHPVPGFVLDPDTRYAVVVTNGVRDLDGYRVRAEPAFAPDSLPPEVDGAVAAAVFTTGHPTRLVEALHALILSLPAPQAEDLEVADETADYYEVRGTYRAPCFQTGTPPYLTPDQGGLIETDGQGRPVVQRTERLRFALTLPRAPIPTGGFPLVLYAHGTGGDYRSFIRRGVAGRLARVTDGSGQFIARVAVLGIDQVVHGERVPPGTSPEVVVFNITNPGSWVYNLVQGAADGLSLARLAPGISFTKLPWSVDSGRSGAVDFGGVVRLDAGRVCVIGHSQGGITSPPFIATSPVVGCAVLSGAGAGAAVSFLEQNVPVDVASLVQLALKEPVDRYHPMVTLWQQILDPADPGCYARRIIAGPPARHLLVTEGIVDHYTPVETTEALATAAALPQLGTVLRPAQGLGLLGIGPASLPATANVDANGGPASVTAGLLQYKGAPSTAACGSCSSTQYCDSETGLCRGDGHHVLFENSDAIRHYSRFVGTFFRDGVPTIGP